MSTSSRYVRPAQPPGLQLQPRDRAICRAVYEHRYLSADHIRQLVFADSSLGIVQGRLRKLWANQILDRHFIPFVLDGVHLPPKTAGRPFYTLARRGAEIVAEGLNLELPEIPHTPAENARGYATLEHHLVATDFLVAILAACRETEAVGVVRFERETTLRRMLAATKRGASALVPDGAVTLSYPGTGKIWTFYIEVVRAGVKGGNETLAARFRRYVEAQRAGIFRETYSHETLRAVIFLTTSPDRTEHFRKLAQALPHGSRLFWFGAYQQPDDRGRDTTTLKTETVLAARWRTVDEELVSIVPPEAWTPRPGQAPAPFTAAVDGIQGAGVIGSRLS